MLFCTEQVLGGQRCTNAALYDDETKCGIHSEAGRARRKKRRGACLKVAADARRLRNRTIRERKEAVEGYTDTRRLDRLQVMAERKGCGWGILDSSPALVSASLARFPTIRDTIDVLLEREV